MSTTAPDDRTGAPDPRPEHAPEAGRADRTEPVRDVRAASSASAVTGAESSDAVSDAPAVDGGREPHGATAVGPRDERVVEDGRDGSEPAGQGRQQETPHDTPDDTSGGSPARGDARPARRPEGQPRQQGRAQATDRQGRKQQGQPGDEQTRGEKPARGEQAQGQKQRTPKQQGQQPQGQKQPKQQPTQQPHQPEQQPGRSPEPQAAAGERRPDERARGAETGRRPRVVVLPDPVREALARIAAPSKVPVWIGRLTYLVALLDILAAILGRNANHRLQELRHVVPTPLASTASAAQLITGLALLPVAHGLVRRKRRAWELAVVGLVLSVATHVLHLQLVAAVLTLVLLVVLVVQRRRFRAVSAATTRWWAVVAFVVMLAVSVLVGYLVVTVDPHLYLGPTTFGARLWYVLQGLVGMGDGLPFRSERAQDRVDVLLGGLGLATVALPALLALRPVTPRPELTDDDDARLRALLDKHSDSLGYFNLRRDKSVVWSESGKAAIAYRVVSGVMLASGDPVGDPEAWPGAIKAFLDQAEEHAWVPAVLGCSEKAGLTWTRGTDFEAIELGDEAVVATKDFSLQGRPMRNVRQMVNRIQRAGYSTQIHRVRDLTDEQAATILADARAWRGTETERGFSMASDRLVDRAADPDAVLVTASQDGRVRGFLQLVPWGRDGVSLDVMLRDKEAEGGVTDLMVVALLQEAPSLGIEKVSLNFATFRAVLERGERLGAGPITRLQRRVLVFLSRWFQIESLYRFNAKFQPEWVPRFLVFPRAGDLPRIGLAAMEAEAFVTWPRLGFLKRFTG